MNKKLPKLSLWQKLFFALIALSIVLTLVLWPVQVTVRPTKITKYDISFLNASAKKARKKLSKMTLEQKIGQSIVIKADSTVDSSAVKNWIDNYHIGGIAFSHISATKTAEFTNYAQSLSDVPLLISFEGDFKNAIPYPNISTIASLSDNGQALDFIDNQISDYRKAGINLILTSHISFDTSRSVSGYSYTDQQDSAFSKMKDFSNACDKNHILASIPDFKETFAFDTSASNKDFKDDCKSLIDNGLPCIKLDMAEIQDHNVKQKLDKELGFKGLVITEGDTNIPGENTDILMTSSELTSLFNQLTNKFKDKKALQNLESSVIKMIQAKSWMRIKKREPLATETLKEEFEGNTRKSKVRTLKTQTITLVKDSKKALPINRIWGKSLMVITIGNHQEWAFTGRCRSYHPAWGKEHKLNKNGSIPALQVDKLKWQNPIVITLNDVTIDAKRDSAFIKSYKKLSRETRVILAHFGSPQNLKHLNADAAILQSNSGDAESMDLVCQAMFGGLEVSGNLAVHVTDSMTIGTGIPLDRITRLRYALPEEVGISSDSLNKIDAIARECIRFRAAPGCQVLIAYKGNVIFNKSYGYHTYKRDQKVRNSDIYDLSSITKVFSTTLATMDLYDNEQLDLEENLKRYFKRELDTLSGCKIKNIEIRNLLLHKSGLQSYMPIVKYLQDEDTMYLTFDRFFCNEQDNWFKIKMGEDLYLRKDVPDSIWLAMKKVRVRNDNKYIYSDLNFNLLQKLIEKVAQTSLDRYVNKRFYVPLGLSRTTYNPLDKFDESIIVPTENDKKWRGDLVHGFAHDQSAALMGGVAGNAGLFSNAHDLAVIGQMLLNGGQYGGKRFFKSETVKTFTEKAEESHRGLGFNKPVPGKMKFIAPSAAHNSYGHTGFAGTSVWIDPDNEIVFVFLSNRIHPKFNNWKLNSYRIRSRIHQVIYDCLDIEPDEETSDIESEIDWSDTLTVDEDLMSDQ